MRSKGSFNLMTLSAIVEHIAGVEDYQIALATYARRVNAGPARRLPCGHGARVIEDRLDFGYGRVDPRPGVASASNLVPKSATSEGEKAKGPALLPPWPPIDSRAGRGE
jgi:hypothetical protein